MDMRNDLTIAQLFNIKRYKQLTKETDIAQAGDVYYWQNHPERIYSLETSMQLGVYASIIKFYTPIKITPEGNKII